MIADAATENEISVSGTSACLLTCSDSTRNTQGRAEDVRGTVAHDWVSDREEKELTAEEVTVDADMSAQDTF